MKPIVTLSAWAIFACVCACNRKTPPPPISTSEYIRPEATAATGSHATNKPRLSFTDITEAAGIDFVHVNGAFGQKWMPETLGSGAAFFDYDGDDRPDILFVNSTWWPEHEPERSPASSNFMPFASPCRLYRNGSNGFFEDVTSDAGLPADAYGMGTAIADYDGDWDPDVFITAVGKDRLLRNDVGLFVDVTDQAGVGFSTCNGMPSEWEWSLGATWLDHDRDGDLDLFVCNYVQWTPETDLWTTRDGKTKSYATPEKYDGASNVLFRNNGDSTFTDVSKEAGVFNPAGKSMSVIADDFNDDGWLDLFVTNDTQPNFLYINQRNGTFVDTALSAGVAYDEAGLARAGMGVDVADLVLDGNKAIAIGNFSGEPVSLYTQVKTGTFVDRSGPARISRPTQLSLTFGVVFADFDLDGYEDLMLANGHIEPEIELVRQDWLFAQKPQLFLNNGDGAFVEATDDVGLDFANRIVGRGLATADIDADGDLDVLFTTNAGPAKLLRNDLNQADRSLRVRLIGTEKNRHAIGARLIASTSDGKRMTRWIRTGGSYLSQSELVATFGLREGIYVTGLEIRWPDGDRETIQTVFAPGEVIIQKARGGVSTDTRDATPDQPS